jgi:hypothetical protein
MRQEGNFRHQPHTCHGLLVLLAPCASHGGAKGLKATAAPQNPSKATHSLFPAALKDPLDKKNLSSDFCAVSRQAQCTATANFPDILKQ